MGTDFSVLFITVSSCPFSFCFICSCESHPLNRFEFLMSLDFSSSLTGFLQNYEEIHLTISSSHRWLIYWTTRLPWLSSAFSIVKLGKLLACPFYRIFVFCFFVVGKFLWKFNFFSECVWRWPPFTHTITMCCLHSIQIDFSCIALTVNETRVAL